MIRTLHSVGIFSLLLISACASGKPAASEQKPPPANPGALRDVAWFSSIPDRSERSRALFLEASRVFLHPRCANCHPKTHPRRGWTCLSRLPSRTRYSLSLANASGKVTAWRQRTVRGPAEVQRAAQVRLELPDLSDGGADTTTRLRYFSSRPGRFHTPPQTCSMAVSKNGARNGSPGAVR